MMSAYEEAMRGASLLLFVALLGVGAGIIAGDGITTGEFRTCRLLLQTADSATVLRTKPECERWTLPVTMEKP